MWFFSELGYFFYVSCFSFNKGLVNYLSVEDLNCPIVTVHIGNLVIKAGLDTPPPFYFSQICCLPLVSVQTGHVKTDGPEQALPSLFFNRIVTGCILVLVKKNKKKNIFSEKLHPENKKSQLLLLKRFCSIPFPSVE